MTPKEFQAIFVIADLQLSGGDQLRLVDKMKILSNLTTEKFRSNNLIVICGDIFESKEPTSSLRETFSNWVRQTIDQGNKVIIVAGNHDMKTKDTTNLCSENRISGDNFHIIKRSGRWYDNLVFIPWIDTISGTSPPPTLFTGIFEDDIVFTHCDFKGAQYPTGMISDTGIDFNFFGESKLIFSGHIHKPQTIENDGKQFIYIGSPFINDWGEVGNETGIYKLTHEGYERIKTQDREHEILIYEDPSPKELLEKLNKLEEKPETLCKMKIISDDITLRALDIRKITKILNSKYLRVSVEPALKNSIDQSKTEVTLSEEDGQYRIPDEKELISTWSNKYPSGKQALGFAQKLIERYDNQN